MGATADLRQLDRVLAGVPTRQSVWPDNGSQRLCRVIGQFDADALLTPVFDYASRALHVVPFDFLNGVVAHHSPSASQESKRSAASAMSSQASAERSSPAQQSARSRRTS